MKNIKVGVMPGKVVEVVLEDGATVREALVAAESSFEINGANAVTEALTGTATYLIKLDGEQVDLTASIQPTSAMIILARATKGN